MQNADKITGQYSQSCPRHAAHNAARWFKLAVSLVLLAVGISGCATASLQHEIKSVRVCAAEECSEAGQHYSATQMLYALEQLFQANDGTGMKFCSADPTTYLCTGDDVGYLVWGGFIPGRGYSNSGKVSQIKLDAENQSIQYTMSMKLRFLGIPLQCKDHDAVLAVRSPHDIAMTDSSYLCNFLLAVMSASFSFVIDSIDFDKGQLGGYWKHGVTGMGYGRGEGYALIEFPKAMPRGENWLARK